MSKEKKNESMVSDKGGCGSVEEEASMVSEQSSDCSGCSESESSNDSIVKFMKLQEPGKAGFLEFRLDELPVIYPTGAFLCYYKK